MPRATSVDLCSVAWVISGTRKIGAGFYFTLNLRVVDRCVCVCGGLLLTARRSSQGSVKNEQKPGAQFDKGSAGELQDAVVSCRKLFSCLDDGCDRLL